MQACFDAFAAERDLSPLSEGVWDECTDALAACGGEEREERMCSILCEHFLREGTEIIITGLQARPELNGFPGTIVGSLSDGRLPVLVRNTAQTRVRLRVLNMRPIGSRAPPRRESRATVQTVDEDGVHCFLYTVGASTIEMIGREPRCELFVRDVPHCKASAAARLLHFLVTRMEDGHLVTEGQYCQCSGLQMEVAIHCPAHAQDLSEAYLLELPTGHELLELIPLRYLVQPSDTHEMWSRVPTIADLARVGGMRKKQLGMPQVLPHQGDILPWPIARAVEAGEEAAVTTYLQEGGYVDARLPPQAGGCTMLMLAAQAGQVRMVVLLLARGAEPNLRHAVAGTALMGAAWMGHAAVVKQLLRTKADPKLRDEDGWNALDFATKPTDDFTGTAAEFAESHSAAAAALRSHLNGA